MQEKVIFYTTHCPKCRALEMRLKRGHIHYEECTDVSEMLAKGIEAAPALGVINPDTSEIEVLDFNNAVKWIIRRGK